MGSLRTTAELYFRRIVRFSLLLALPALCVWGVYHLHRNLKLEEYRNSFLEDGFPESYVENLAELKFDHPKWRFEVLKVEGMTWKEIVKKELTPSWNLVAADKEFLSQRAPNAKAYDSGAWYQASEEAIGYYMDPRNFLNERDVFQFETLGFDGDSQTLKAVEKTLSKTFMDGKCYDRGKRTFAELVHEVGKRHGISPVFLAGRLVSEQGRRGSTQAFGTIGDTLFEYAAMTNDCIGSAVIWGNKYTRDNAATKKVLSFGRAEYNGYYNFFNFRAYGSGMFEIKYNAYLEAKNTAIKYLAPWNTQARAIEGGAMKLKERFIDTARHTRYLQKFAVLKESGPYRFKQYMQHIAAPLIESRNTYRSYRHAKTLNAPYRFLIPVYVDMP